MRSTFTYKRIQRFLFPALIGLAVFSSILTGGKAGGDLIFQPSLEKAREEAKRLHRPLLLVFEAPGCGWCRKLDNSTFTDPKVLSAERNYLNVRLDSSTDETEFRRYEVSETPACLFLDADGQELHRISGYRTPSQFLDSLQVAQRNASLPASPRRPHPALPLFLP